MKRNVMLFGLGGCVGLAGLMALFAILSWWGGEQGLVRLYFNAVNERLVETILFPLWAGLGGWAAYTLLAFYDDHTGKGGSTP